MVNTPGQILQIILSLIRTNEIEQCIPTTFTHSLTEVLENCMDHIQTMVKMLRNSKQKIPVPAVKSLIATNLYYRDWCHEMITTSATNRKNVSWHNGMRFYLESDADVPTVVVRQHLESAVYGFEYTGTVPRLIWSQSTEKGYRAIWGAIQMKMGLVGYGGESVGKLEIYKDFARALGNHSLVFNCGYDLSSKVLSRLLTGMAMTGCFLILTNIDCLNDSNISLIMNSISNFRDAMMKNESSLNFLGHSIKIPRNAILTCLSTISPKNSVLPRFTTHVRSQMRVVSFCMPNIVAWTQSKMYTHGFEESEKLGQKLANLFLYALDHVSIQSHYDFSIRTLRVILKIAESHLRKGSLGEKDAIITAINSYVIPKLIFDDIEIFRNFMALSFGPHTTNTIINEKLHPEVEDISFLYHRKLVRECIDQFTQLMEHGQHAIVLGKAGVGKSTTIKSVSKLLKADLHIINPLGIPSGFLFGVDEAMSFEKGILEFLLENQVSTEPKWILFDGPFGSWVENISALLMKEAGGSLCLTNGKRIFLDNSTTVMST